MLDVEEGVRLSYVIATVICHAEEKARRSKCATEKAVQVIKISYVFIYVFSSNTGHSMKHWIVI